MSEEELDIEPRGNSLDGTHPSDPDMTDTANSIGEVVKARRPKAPKHQGRRGRKPRVEDPSASV